MKKVRIFLKKDGVFIVLALLPALAMMCIFTFYPMIKGSVMAFQDYNLFNISNIKWVGFDNFKVLFTPSALNSFYRTISNTVKWVAVSLLFQCIIGFAMALILKKPFKGQGMYKGLIFFPWAVSGFMIGIMWRWMYNGTSGVINDVLMRLHIISQPVGWLASADTALNSVIVANIWYGIPFFTIMITAALKGIPDDVYEAASVDGAGPIKKFFSITLPYVKPVLLLTLLLRAIWIFNFPELIYSMTNGGPAGSSHIITSYMMELVQGLNYGMASAVGVVVMLILSLFTVLYLLMTRFEEGGDF